MAFVRRHNDIGNICVVARRGDPIAGQVFIEVDHLDGTRTLFTPAPYMARDNGAGPLFQKRFSREGPDKVQARIAQEVNIDPDLWVLSLDLRSDEIGVDLVPDPKS